MRPTVGALTMRGAALFCLLTSGAFAQQPGTGAPQATFRTQSNLVLVPTLVEGRSGEPVFGLTAKDFTVTDNGVPQKIRVEAGTDHAPMSIVLLVQTGRSAYREFNKMVGLPTMAEGLAGDVSHRIAVVAFDSQPHQILDFTNAPGAVRQAVYSIEPGDDGAAILDAVWYAVDMLDDEPQQNQRVILLLSETRDHGSRTPVRAVVRKIGRSDVVVYSLAFSPARGDLFDFSGAGGSADLLAPLRMAIQAVRRNTAAAIPNMTGGRYLRFNHGKQFDAELGQLTNQVHNRYVLSFQPPDPAPGFHQLRVTLNEPLQAKVLARTNYWAAGPVAEDPPATTPEPSPQHRM
jgi:VWFA-related protein